MNFKTRKSTTIKKRYKVKARCLQKNVTLILDFVIKTIFFDRITKAIIVFFHWRMLLHTQVKMIKKNLTEFKYGMFCNIGI